jgi:hypothetical protein
MLPHIAGGGDEKLDSSKGDAENALATMGDPHEHNEKPREE